MAEHVFLTGANGFLGHNLTRQLIGSGYRVTAFILPGTSTQFLQPHPLLDIREGSLLSYPDVLAAMKDCDSIIHAGANTTVSPARDPMIYQVNVNGTRHVMEAALALKVRKMVHIASASIFGYGTLDRPGDENSPFSCGHFHMDYHGSKLAAYEELQQAVRERGLPAVTVCPTFMLGAYDAKPSSGAMLLALYQGKIPGYTSGGRNYIHVRDVVAGIVNALEYGRDGEAYIFGNRNLNYKDVFELMADVMHIDPPGLYVPDFAIKIFGAFNSAAAWLTDKAPTISYEMTRVACAGFYYSAQKAVDELDLPQTPLETAVADAMNWFLENGYIEGRAIAAPEPAPNFQYGDLGNQPLNP